MIYVEFGDSEETQIVSVFYSPQDPEEHPNLVELSEDDERYKDFASRALAKEAEIIQEPA